MPETPAPKTLRMTVLRVLLGFLMLTALVAIIDVWTEVDEDGKLLLSAVALSLASLLALPGAAQRDRSKSSRSPAAEWKSPAGLVTMLLAVVAAITTLWMIWFEPQNPDLLNRVVSTAWLWSASVSLHALVSLATLRERATWMKIAAPVVTYAGAVMTTLAIYEVFEFEDWVMYLTATLYILAGLANVAVLIMHLMYRYERGLAAQQLVLDEDGDDWRDLRSGRRYRVSEA